MYFLINCLNDINNDPYLCISIVLFQLINIYVQDCVA